MKVFGRDRRFIMPLVLVSIAAVGTMAVLAAINLRNLHHTTTGYALLQSTNALANVAIMALHDKQLAQDFCLAAARHNQLRVTLIALDGRVLGDSQAQPDTMENHKDRPEVVAALAGTPGIDLRTSVSVGEKMYYAAVPIRQGQETLGILRMALKAPDLAERLLPFYISALVSALLVGFAAVYANVRLAARLSRPVRSLVDAAQAWSQGLLDFRLPSFQDNELAIVPMAMNSMAADLKSRIEAMDAARQELSVLLNCMAEAVIAVDSQLNIRIINQEAGRLFDQEKRSTAELIGKSLLQVSGQLSLENLAKSCLTQLETQEEELTKYGETVRHFIAYASPVLWENQASGVVIVLNDISKLKQLEKIRKDFVANVSHELRTPITLIKGFVETLDAGAIERIEDARRFLAIINRNTDRMSAVIHDLLALAQLEHPDRQQLEKCEISVRHLFNSAIMQIADKAKERNILVQSSSDRDLKVFGNEGLLEQALINLLDNAIKYGKPDSTVRLKAACDAEYLVFSVEDKGPGIPARAVPRIFERFYRVDQARSRDLGGTGLGLSIVKHIALAHDGTVEVESREGKGSTFSFKLPLAQGKI